MRIRFSLFSLFLILLPIVTLMAQKIKDPPKGSYVDTLNRYYQQTSLPVYIYVSYSKDKASTLLSKEEIQNKDEIKPIYLDGNGKHMIRHINAQEKDIENFIIYADGIAPISIIKFLNANRFFTGNRNYYGQGLKIDLTSKDDYSGVEDIHYSINESDFVKYNSQVEFLKEGEYNFQFYAVDNVGNVEKTHKFLFTVDLTPPHTYYNIVGVAKGNVISTSTVIYLTTSDTISGLAETYYCFDNEPFKLYSTKSILTGHLSEGEHILKYYSIDNVGNKEPEGSYTFFFDKSAPIMATDILGDKFLVNNRMYFSGRTKLKLTAVDNKSGVKQVMYSVDGDKFIEYQEPFYLPRKSGLHIIRFFAIDNLGNEGLGGTNKKFGEYEHNMSVVYVDLTGPSLNYHFIGNKFKKGDTIYIGNDTRIEFSSNDAESGLKFVSYSLDGETVENKYSGPFTINISGPHKIDYFGYDNVNNRNVDKFFFAVDNIPPEIFYNFSVSPNIIKDSLGVYPSYVTLYLGSTDQQTGNADIYYSINGGKEYLYKLPLQKFDKEKVYTISVKAIDKLRNQATREIKFMTDKY